MRRNIRNIMTVILMLSLAGCGKKETEQMQQQMEDKADVTFEGNNIELEGMEGTLLSYTVKSGKLYLLTKGEAEGEKEYSYQFYSSDADGNAIQTISQQTEEEIVAFCVDSDGNIAYIAGHTGEEVPVAELVRIDDKGTELARREFNQIVKNGSILLGGMVSDHTGQIVLASGEAVYFLDGQLEANGETKAPEGYVVDIALTKEGEMVCVTDQLDSIMVSAKVFLLDSEKRQWKDMPDLKLDGNGDSDYVMDGLEYDFYYKGSGGIYGYDIAAQEKTEIINYNASYMTNSDAAEMNCIQEGHFIGRSENITEDQVQMTLVSYQKKDVTAASEKEVITFGTMRAGSNVKSAVAKFNRSNSEYEIVIEEYMNMEQDRLLSDIATGNGPDIMDLEMLPLSVVQCISKGLIEDLTPYYENDSEIHADGLIDSVREAMEYQGKLYYVTPCFSVTTMAARRADVGDGSGWTISDLRNLMEKKKEDIDLFAYKDTKESYLFSFLYYSGSDFIDWENGTCNFDSDDFKYILKLCNEKGMKEETEETDAEIMERVNSLYTRFKNGAYILLEEEDLDLRMIQFERLAVGNDITYIGYPNRDKNGSVLQFGNKFAISSQSGRKAQAWEFIRTFLTKEYQRSLTNDDDMPVVKEMFDSRIKALTTTESYINEFGDMIEPVEEYPMTWGDIEVQMGIPTQEDVEVYLNLINQANRSVDGDEFVYRIIDEEAADYFKGKRKLDQTVEIIQSRVTTYVNEQRK